MRWGHPEKNSAGTRPMSNVCPTPASLRTNLSFNKCGVANLLETEDPRNQCCATCACVTAAALGRSGRASARTDGHNRGAAASKSPPRCTNSKSMLRRANRPRWLPTHRDEGVRRLRLLRERPRQCPRPQACAWVGACPPVTRRWRVAGWRDRPRPAFRQAAVAELHDNMPVCAHRRPARR